MISLLIEVQTVRIDKIAGTHDVGASDSWNHVTVLETAIEDSDRHALAQQSDVMQTVPCQHLNLLFSIAIG